MTDIFRDVIHEMSRYLQPTSNKESMDFDMVVSALKGTPIEKKTWQMIEEYAISSGKKSQELTKEDGGIVAMKLISHIGEFMSKEEWAIVDKRLKNGSESGVLDSISTDLGDGTSSGHVRSTVVLSNDEQEPNETITSHVSEGIALEELMKVPGIGPMKAKILFEAGITDLRMLKRASVVELTKIRGIGRKAAGEIKFALRECSLEELRNTELTEDNIERELQCPLCATVVSAYESSCYECGYLFKSGEGDLSNSDMSALSYYDAKLLKTPDNKELWYAKGATLAKMEKYEDAIDSFNKAIAIDSSFQTAWISKADAYNRLGEPSKAAECYRHILAGAPKGEINGADSGSSSGGSGYEHDELGTLSSENPAAMTNGLRDTAETDMAPHHEFASAKTEQDAATPILPDCQEPAKGYASSPIDNLDYELMPETELKECVSKRAKIIKKYLSLAKKMDVDIGQTKSLISRAVKETKRDEFKAALPLMDEGITFAEKEFHRTITGGINDLAKVIQHLKSTGIDITLAADLIKSSKDHLESGKIIESAEQFCNCLEDVENIAG